MTIEKFKSLALSTLTGDKPFYLQFMLHNDQTLNDLEERLTAFNKKFGEKDTNINLYIKSDGPDAYKEKFYLYYTLNGEPGKLKHLYNRNNLYKDLKHDLRSLHPLQGDETTYEMTFGDTDDTDVSMYIDTKHNREVHE